MGQEIRILHLEDEAVDSELMTLMLQEAGLEASVRRVDTRDAFLAALESDDFDLIVSDFSLPAYNGLGALAEARQRRPGLAFVFFSGTLGEERAVQALKAGATDFVVKGVANSRLVPAVRRALEEAREKNARLRAERALLEREESFRLLFQSNPHPMWVHDRESRGFLEVNAAAVAHYGYTRDEFLSMRTDDLTADGPGQSPPPSSAVVRAADETAAFHRRKDGQVIEVQTFGHDLPFGGRPGRLVVAHDVTETRQLQAQLLQAQKMEAVGRLAGGIAHDFNNLLSIILGFADLCLRRLDQPEVLRERLTQIGNAGRKAATLTRQLLAFSRKQILQPRVLDLNAVVAELEKMLRRVIGEDVQLVTVTDEHLGRVKIDPAQLEQVLMNLVVNARDAMPHGGRLTIETANVDLDDRYPSRFEVRPGRYAMLAVSDTGVGMDPATLVRIFEPFFTTKSPDKGTGLGLATVHGIVRQSEGYVWVYSEPEHGTTFKIYLPRVEEGLDPQMDAAAGERPAARGGETVLVVEDEDVLRQVVEETLTELGYRVVSASGPAAALAVLERTPAVHALLTDVVMPGMSGPELWQRVRTTHPGARVLFMSGYADEAMGYHGMLPPGAPFLQKPFTVESLARTIRGLLDRAS